MQRKEKDPEWCTLELYALIVKELKKHFIKTGEYNFVPGIDRDKYDSETDLKEALKRDKKIH